MSVLETPRIYFRGEVDWDPIVTNNGPNFYDEVDATTVFPKAIDRVAQFRRNAIAAVGRGTWNPHGTHRSTFYNSIVSGADLGAGLVQNDPFVNSPASFRGMLVDLEPYGSFSSQLFFDSIRFGIDGGYRIAAPRTSRFTARYINFARNAVGAIAGIASAVWQTTFPKTDGLRIDAFDSPALQALQKALDANDVLGLTIQWNSYRTIYFNTPGAVDKLIMAQQSCELTAKLAGGGFQPNPARSMMVGTIGLWRAGEPVHEPCDRALITGPDDNPGPPTIGTAHARLGGETITLDLSNSISETGLDLTKANFGELSVVAVDASGAAPVTLASFDYPQYDREAYLATSGIVTLPVKADALKTAQSSDLQLRDAAGGVLLAEQALRALAVAPNLYVDQNDKATATLQVYSRGVPAGAGIQVMVCVMSADGSTVDSTFTVTTTADGTVTFPLVTSAPAITAYVPLPGPNPVQPTQGIDPQVYTYMYVRVLPADVKIAQLPPTWENVYGRVLANWHAMAPCMDNWLDLGNEAQVRSFGPMIKKLTDPNYFEHFRYMPVTRDLTPGSRTLLYNFLDSTTAEAPVAAKLEMSLESVPGAEVAQAAPAPAAEAKVNFAELSKKMRP